MVKIGDLIEFEFDDKVQKDENLFEYKLDIIFENNDFIVINKPSGLNTIPSRKEPIKSLYNALYTYLKSNNKLNTIHIITRLDKMTSGLVLCALNKETALYMNKNHTNMNKLYYAMVKGILKDNEFFIEKPIKKSEDSMKRIISEDGAYSKTLVNVVKRFEDKTLCEIKLFTGRTHQIRLHLSSIGYPICGDNLYSNDDGNLMLCCKSLEFENRDGLKYSFNILPCWKD